MRSWALGAVVYVSGAGLIVLGENLVKRSTDEDVAAARRRTWLLGVSAFLLGNVSHFVAFMFAAQSMLEALNSSVLLWNLLIASLVNKEHITTGHLMAVGVIICGTLVALFFGPHGQTSHSLDDLLTFFTRPSFLTYMAALAVLLSCLQAAYLLERQRLTRAGLDPESSWVAALSFAGVSAGIGSNGVILSKCLAEALHSVLSGARSDRGVVAPLLLVGVWVLLAVWWLARLNNALQRFPALFIVPALHAVWMANSIVGGAIFFDEFEGSAVVDMVVFGLGVLVILSGVVLMPTHKGQSSDGRVDEEGSPEFEPLGNQDEVLSDYAQKQEIEDPGRDLREEEESDLSDEMESRELLPNATAHGHKSTT